MAKTKPDTSFNFGANARKPRKGRKGRKGGPANAWAAYVGSKRRK
jgi:hypothetical protein